MSKSVFTIILLFAVLGEVMADSGSEKWNVTTYEEDGWTYERYIENTENDVYKSPSTADIILYATKDDNTVLEITAYSVFGYYISTHYVRFYNGSLMMSERLSENVLIPAPLISPYALIEQGLPQHIREAIRDVVNLVSVVF